ncbi:MAG: hypothetical protein P4L99_21800 [Chthoniobacter sp.]|nr:hypothetical protein [Chthoniobacter sp.]
MHPLPAHLTLPEHVHYDGAQEGSLRGRLLQFTDRKEGPSCGATFYITEKHSTSVELQRRVNELRAEFYPLPVNRRMANR